ncbi:transcriptional regulator [[Eubacterium] siraeum CAG:80]|uniref:Transcriptional regulator n=1 Tax=[Eubacterium] siraeum CAG:80 TaxID=1263080 RepID=R6RJA0_9FIRM|nr:transcriptional regulator [[Eubacterium] siraeum CAG:80]
MEDGFRTGAEALLKNMPGCRIDEYMLHWLAHMDIEMFIHLLTHVPEKEKGLAYAEKMIGAMVKMWFDLLFVKDE